MHMAYTSSREEIMSTDKLSLHMKGGAPYTVALHFVYFVSQFIIIKVKIQFFILRISGQAQLYKSIKLYNFIALIRNCEVH